ELGWDAAWQLAEAKESFDGTDEDDEDSRKTLARPARTRVDSPSGAGPASARPQTAPVPLVPTSDHTPGWMPPRGPASGPMSASPGSMGPASSGRFGPGSSGQPPASGLVLELQLSAGETTQLRKLCKAMGYDAVDMVKHALREAHRARFGDEE
ncbi:MAG: hypothetical protein RIF41_10625, partial [Polyangiaceae bacterium]